MNHHQHWSLPKSWQIAPKIQARQKCPCSVLRGLYLTSPTHSARRALPLCWAFILKFGAGRAVPFTHTYHVQETPKTLGCSGLILDILKFLDSTIIEKTSWIQYNLETETRTRFHFNPIKSCSNLRANGYYRAHHNGSFGFRRNNAITSAFSGNPNNER